MSVHRMSHARRTSAAWGERVLALLGLGAVLSVPTSCGGKGAVPADAAPDGIAAPLTGDFDTLVVKGSDHLLASGPVGGPFGPSATYTLINTSAEQLRWIASATASWVEVSESAGSLLAGESGLLVVSVDAAQASAFAAGTYSAKVSVGVRGGSTALTVLPAFLTVKSPRMPGPPTLIDVTPRRGPAGGKNRVSLSGSGFRNHDAGTNVVTFGGVAATQVSVISDTRVDCTVPAGPAESETDVAISNENGAATLSSGYRYNAFPTLTDLDPKNGTPGGGETVTLSGSGFQVDEPGFNRVTFGGRNAAQIVVLSDTTLTCRAPAGVEGSTMDVSVANANGLASMPDAYSYETATPVSIVPGSGWTGPTPEPAPIVGGTRYDTAKVIARFDFVLGEYIDQVFGIGLVAFHANGVDHVDIAVEGGPFTTITDPTLNPSTGIVEYWARLNPADFTTHGRVEVRAIAYPKSGGVPNLQVAELFVNPGTLDVVEKYCSPAGDDVNDGSESSPCRNIARAAARAQQEIGSNADGAIVYLQAGSYDWRDTGDVISNLETWTRIMPAPGVTRDQVVIGNDGGGGPNIKDVQCIELTFDRATMRLTGHSNGQRFYGVDCLIQGPDVTDTSGRNGTNWLAGNSWAGVYYSGCEWRDTFSGPERAVLVRNCRCVNIAEDAYGSAVLMLLNSSVDNMDAGILNDEQGAAMNLHSDVWALGLGVDYDNIICYGLKATSCSGQGLWFSADNKNLPSLISNVAIVNFEMYNRVGGLRGNSKSHFGADSQLDHVLLVGCLINGQTLTFNYDEANSKNVLIKGNCFEKVTTGAGENAGIPAPLLDASAIQFVDNHYVDSSGLVPGIGATTGNPIWTAYFIDSGYRVANPGGYDVGAKTIAVDAGFIALREGMMVSFGSLPPNNPTGNRDFTPREYTISKDVGFNATSITIEPGLREPVPEGDRLVYTDYRPIPGSPLHGRVSQPYLPVDIDRITRAVQAAVGPYE